MWNVNGQVQSTARKIFENRQSSTDILQYSARLWIKTKLHNSWPWLPAHSLLYKRISILYWKQASYFQQYASRCSEPNWMCLWVTQGTLEIFNKNCWFKVWICSSCNVCMFCTTYFLWKPEGLWHIWGGSTGPNRKTQSTWRWQNRSTL